MAIRGQTLTSLLALAGALAGPAKASAAGPEPPAVEASEPDRPPIVLAISGPRRGDIEMARLEPAIGEELGAPVIAASDQPTPAGAARLELVLTDNQLVVRHTSPEGRVLERTVDRPADGQAMIEAVTWLAGNLGRDEAGELIEGLTAQTSEAEPTEEEAQEPPQAPKSALPEENDEPAALTDTNETEPTPGASYVGTPVQLTLAHPLALYPDGEHRRFSFELGAFYSRLGALRGSGVNAIAHRIDADLEGVQLSGVWAHHNGDMQGVRIAGAVTSGTSADATGATIAGLVDLQGGEGKFSGQRLAGLVTAHDGFSRGVMIGGAGNVLASAEGVAIGGVFNFVGRRDGDELRGLAIAGAINRARNAEGVMLGGAGNVAADLDGLQVSGGFNGARRLRGAQIGFINVAERVEGTQIGFLNVAREVEGVALGPLNFVEKSRIQALVYASSAAPLSTGIRFVLAPLVTTTSIGYDPLGEDHRIIPQVALGGRLPFGPLYADLEAGYAPEIEPANHPSEDPVQTVRFRGSIGWDALPPIGIFAAGGVRYAIDPRSVGPEVLGGITVL